MTIGHTVIVVVLAVIGVIFLITWVILGIREGWDGLVVPLSLGLFFLTCALIYGLFYKDIDTFKREIKEEEEALETALETALDKNYSVFLDGVEVEAENLDLSLYQIKVDTEKKKVFCTRK